MKTNLIYGTNPVPTAYVTKRKQRVKQYNNTVFLNNGDEFEIELFNPTSNKVLAKIELNGISIGSGIILRPGERVYLERYLNEAKKFLFETYLVNGDNNEVKRAIENNGNVNVKFYNQYFQNYFYTYQSPSITITPSWTGTPFTYDTSGHIYYSNTSCNCASGDNSTFGGTSTTLTSSSCCSATSSVYDDSLSFDSPKQFKSSLKAKTETGRIEKGSNSNQSFKYDSTEFNTYWSWESNWKILPISQKQITSDDLKEYCTKCGRARKKGDNFCAKCGKQF